jgi:hypothetical protein
LLKSLKLRLALSAALLAIGFGLPVWALEHNGPPWSFQDRAGVLLSTTGNIEAYGSGGGALVVTPGLWLKTSDEVRVGALSAAVVRTPAADLELADGARVIFGPEGASLARGLLRLQVPEGNELRVFAEGLGEAVALGAGRYRLTADGKGRLYAFVEQGRATSSAGLAAKAGELVLLAKGAAASVSAAAEGLVLEATVAGEVLKGTAAPGAQLYVNGRLLHLGAEGSFSEALPPGEGSVVLFARDPTGNTARKVLARVPEAP